ncbi:MAG TPA: FAD-dependent oxidoreductase [Candidatus Udaeobacter sp.]|jgi:pyruvate/2-oxoglutarate dehydrogenase complex dihydrolipoamide dehydrogenase (E3) component
MDKSSRTGTPERIGPAATFGDAINSTSEPEKYDVLVLGAGTGGKLIAWTMASEGKRTASIERKYIGGACPNIACLPSKNIIHSAKVASLFSRHQEFGIETGPVTVNMAGVYARKKKMVDDLVKAHLDQYQASGAELICGNARFIGPRTLEVALRDGGERTLTGERVFVNVGTHAAIPDIPGLANAKPMTHIEVLDLQRLPEHLIVLGGGYVGMELAQAMRRFGSRVTLIAREPQLAPKEDADVAQAILELFRDEEIEVLLRTQILNVKGTSGERVELQVEDEAGTRTINGTDILAALGRVPNTQGIGLDKAGIEVTERGHIRVNDRLETTAPNVWAVGECAGSPYFTHVSENDFHIVHANLNGDNRSTRDRLIPYCLFTDPPLGRVGINESQAWANNISYRVASLPMEAVFRTQTLSETRGFIKVIIDAHSDRILGFTAFGPEAGELMANVQVAMLAGVPYTLLRDAVFTHPTMSEGLGMLFARVPKQRDAAVEKRGYTPVNEQ